LIAIEAKITFAKSCMSQRVNSMRNSFAHDIQHGIFATEIDLDSFALRI